VTALRVIFTGSGEFGIPSLRAMLDAGHSIVNVFTQPDRPAGRGRKLTPTPVAQFAADRGLPLIRTANINQESLPHADVMVVIAFGQKIGEPIVDHPRLGSVNLHASRLPKYRGAAPINAAILAGESITGNSVIRLAQKMDTGAILGQSSLQIGEFETAGELHDRLAADGAPLILSVLQSLADGNVREIEQDNSQVTLAKKLSRESARIDWNLPADQIARQIRAMYPWPGCRVRLIDPRGAEVDRLTLVRARGRACSSCTSGRPSDDTSICAGAGTEVGIIELQPEGKRPMPLAAYRNGNHWEYGMRMESLV